MVAHAARAPLHPHVGELEPMGSKALVELMEEGRRAAEQSKDRLPVACLEREIASDDFDLHHHQVPP